MEKTLIVTSVNGQALYVGADQTLYPLVEGMVLVEGTEVILGQGALVNLGTAEEPLTLEACQYCKVVSSERPDSLVIQSKVLAPDDIIALIEMDGDPSDVIAPPAELSQGGEHSDGAWVLRTAKATLAEAGYDTLYQPKAPVIERLETQEADSTRVIDLTPLDFTVVEGQTNSGNLLELTGALDNRLEFLDSVNGQPLSSYPLTISGDYEGFYRIDLAEGQLYLNANGDFIFVAIDEFDHSTSDSISFADISVLFADTNGAFSQTTLSWALLDGADPTGAIADVAVSDVGMTSIQTVSFDKGSDSLSVESLHLDLASIARSLQLLQLTSSGRALDTARLSVVDGKLTIFDTDGNPVFAIQLGEAIVGNDGSVQLKVEVTQLAPLDHEEGSNGLVIPIEFLITDRDGDETISVLNVFVADDRPTAADIIGVLVEAKGGSQISGNLNDHPDSAAPDADYGADGAGQITEVNGIELSSLTAEVGGAFDGYYAITVDEGTLYVLPDGSYTFVAVDGLDHSGGDLVIEIPFVLEDSDFDGDDATLTLTLADGAAPIAAVTDFNISDDGSDDSQTVTIERGSDPLDPDSVGFDLQATADALAALGLSSDGVPLDFDNLQVTGNGTLLTILDENGDPVLQVSIENVNIDGNGDGQIQVTITPLAPLDHAPGSDSLALPIILSAEDTDGSAVSAALNIAVADAQPEADDVAASVVEGEATVVANLLDNSDFGSDGSG
ncbi:hypothetical protein, partial [Ferrimonas pelagia]|uniref:hypothetical protein n=1 Tax=Ferrimonas pelagia TaxID=1177826 RepID=UPI0031EA6626